MATKVKSTEKEHYDAFQQLGSATDEFERYKEPHASLIASVADEVAQHFLLAGRDRKSLRAAAILHDLGEASMEREYIQRSGPLTDEERVDLARHPIIGEQESSRIGADRATSLLVRWHHEWWNGGGYPDGLRGEEIPLAARILRVVDSYASLLVARPFRPRFSREEARRLIVRGAGVEFDPRVVRIVLDLDLFKEVEPEQPLAPELPAEEHVSKPREDERVLFSSFMK